MHHIQQIGFQHWMESLSLIVIFFLCAKFFSTLIYQLNWKNGYSDKFILNSTFIQLLSQRKLWFLHIPIFILLSGESWSHVDAPLAIYLKSMMGILSLGALGRMGSLLRNTFFIWDRLLIVSLYFGLFFHPAFSYPLLLAILSLQYHVSQASFSPGYSNLLGFEFQRMSVTAAIFALIFQLENPLLMVLLFQATYYFQQAIGKNVLSKNPFEWIYQDKLECLWVNSYLRGWLGPTLSKSTVLKIAKVISSLRPGMNGGTWLIEFSWLFVFFDLRLAILLYLFSAIFHLVVWIMCGLAAYHFIINHIMMLFLLNNMLSDLTPGSLDSLGFVLSALIITAWVFWVRYHIYNNHISLGHGGVWEDFSEASDHLMSWWNTPFMRMYSYEVETVDGAVYSFPVTKFSPYDTFLTDIHTHLMVLKHPAYPHPYLTYEQQASPNGVWGLTIDQKHRDMLYGYMNSLRFDKKESSSYKGLGLTKNIELIGSSKGYWNEVQSRMMNEFKFFFEKLNQNLSSVWFRRVMRWPHFPGEDWVPDINPLSSRTLRSYEGQDPVAKLRISAVKTFYTGDDIQILSDEQILEIEIKT